MKELLFACVCLSVFSFMEARGNGRTVHRVKSANDTTAHNKVTKWEMEESEPDRVRSDVPATSADISDVIAMLESMSADIQSLRSQVTNVKYQNHLIYRQLKKANNRCLAPATAGMMAMEPEPLMCPEEFTYNENFKSCYKFAADRITWRMAREKCLAQGADLVSIENGREQRFIMEKARNSKDLRHCDFWTGLSDSDREGVWKWKGTGRSASWTNWNLNEPNNGSGDENCMHMLWVFNWAWNDARCNYDNSCYICEIKKKNYN